MSYEDFTVISVILNIIEFSVNLVSWLISCFVCIQIIHYMYSHRALNQEKLAMILCLNIYFVIFILMMTRIRIQIDVFKGDLFGYNPDSIYCQFMGYAVIVLASNLYYSFVNQVCS